MAEKPEWVSDMHILLASAKIMRDLSAPGLPATSPRFADEARRFALEMSSRSPEQLASDLHCNPQIALENLLRYQDFFNDSANRPAILAYHGQAYKCLKAENFSAEDLGFAQQHLTILSFLYGMLRPLDLIHAYRMEAKITTEAAGGKNMFAFWKPRLTDLLLQTVHADDGILLHLATAEYQNLFDWRRINRETMLIQPHFLVRQPDGTLKNVTVYAKSCRGAMTRFIIQNRLTSPSGLAAFSYEGFAYDSRLGDDRHPHFVK